MDFSSLFLAQKQFQPELQSQGIKARKQKLKAIEKWMLKNKKAIEQAVETDFQKPALEVALSEIYPMLIEVRHTLKNLRSWMRPKPVDTPLQLFGTSAAIHYEPKGTALIISPWNYPFSLGVSPIIAAVGAGCTFILKPSEYTPSVSALLKNMVSELFPEKWGCVVEGDASTAQALLEFPFDHLFFTGSPAVGKHIMKAASKHLSSVTLELGGKSPVVIDANANLKLAAKKIAWGKMLNAGQTCVAPDYILVPENLKSSFIQYYQDAIVQFYPDIPQNKRPKDMASIVNKKHFDRLDQALQNTPNTKLLRVATLDQIPDENYLFPTVVDTPDSDAYWVKEEIFGPVLPVIGYATINAAIATINQHPKALSLYIFGSNKKNIKKVLQRTSSGTVVVNDVLIQFAHAELPFGGVNNSGIGKAHGHAGFLAFSNEKSVLRQHFKKGTNALFFPPYSKFKMKLLYWLMKYL